MRIGSSSPWIAAQLRRAPDLAPHVVELAVVDRRLTGPHLADLEALVEPLSTRLDAQALAQLPRLKVLAACAVGYDNIDLAAAARAGIAVTHTPGVLTEATAEFAFALLLACSRRVVEADGYVRAGRWHGFAMDLMLGQGLTGRTLGIIGMGRIGRAMATRARAFGMRVIYARGHDPLARAVSLATLWAEADVVSLHCPGGPATQGLVGPAALAACRPGLILINTARGTCVDEPALASALVEGRIGAAGLDVFAHEPQIAQALLAAPRTVLAPHLGSATTEVRSEMVAMCAESVRAALAGQPIPRQVPSPGAA